MEKFTLARTDNRPLRFTGELLGEAESSYNNASPVYSGAPGRKSIFQLYQTDKGKYVCRASDLTLWQGEHDVHFVAVVDDLWEVYDFFAERGPYWLAEWLFEEAGISAHFVEEI